MIYTNSTEENIIRVVFARNPPDAWDVCRRFPTLLPTVACAFPGWCLEIIRQVTEAMHLKIQEIPLDNEIGVLDWGTLQDDGNWTGVIGYLANGTTDTACLMFQRTELREEFFDFSYPVTNIQPIYVVRRKKETIGSVLWNAFKPYSTVTWIVIVASFIAQTLVMIGVMYTEKKLKKRDRFRPYEMLWHCVQLQLDEGSEDMRFYTVGGNIVLFFFSLMQAGLLIMLYEGLLLSSLLRQADSNPFKDADGMIKMVATGEYKLVTDYIGDWYFDELKHSNVSHFVDLRKATANNPVVQVDSVDEALDKVEEGNYIYPCQEDSTGLQMSKERCNLVYVTQGLPQRSSHFVLSQNSRFKKLMDEQIVLQQPFIRRTFNKYFMEGWKIGTIPKCDTSEFDENLITKPLDLASVIGIFTLGGIGILVSLISLFAEIYLFWHCRILDKRNMKLAVVRHLYALAEIHFHHHEADINIMNLMDTIDRQIALSRKYSIQTVKSEPSEKS